MARSPTPTASELKRKPVRWLAFASELKNEPLVWLAFASELKNKPPNWLAFASCASRERANFPEMPTSALCATHLVQEVLSDSCSGVL